MIIYYFTVYVGDACFDSQTPPSTLPPPPLYTEEDLVVFTEDQKYFNSPSVYRGRTPKGGGGSFAVNLYISS